jgi:hypothetical protein
MNKFEMMIKIYDFEPVVPLASEKLMYPLEWLVYLVESFELYAAAVVIVDMITKGLIG